MHIDTYAYRHIGQALLICESDHSEIIIAELHIPHYLELRPASYITGKISITTKKVIF